jgi:hypothetical protein
VASPKYLDYDSSRSAAGETLCGVVSFKFVELHLLPIRLFFLGVVLAGKDSYLTFPFTVF